MGAYIGVVGAARNIKSGYVGVEGKARQIKKGYVGVNGVARPFFAPGGLVYYGQAAPLSSARYGHASAKIGNYVLFAGGVTNNVWSAVVDAYDSALTKYTPLELTVARSQLTGAWTGLRAIFAGGYTGTDYSTVVDSYDANLVRYTASSLRVARATAASGTVYNSAQSRSYAFIAGGQTTGGISTASVDGFDPTGVRTNITDLSAARDYLAGASYKDNTVRTAVFAGGSTPSSVVDGYTLNGFSTIKSVLTALSVARLNLAGGAIGDHVVFAGGTTGSVYSNAVDAYSKTFTRTTPNGLSVARSNLASTSIGDFVLFAGGNNGAYSDAVDAYNSTLTRSTPTALVTARDFLAAETIGDFALIAGGRGDTPSAAVDVYTVAA